MPLGPGLLHFSEADKVPPIDVTYDGTVDEETLHRLGELLSTVVGETVEYPEEPATGPDSRATSRL
jgi:hypothetical protein